jgi:serine/threonine-protein kinase
MGMTSTQAVMGSPLYMSPEQMRSSKDVDARSDIWALGTVLYEALAGAPPFDGETVTALIIKITQDQPPPMRLRRPDIPPQLEAAILGALEKDRTRRFQTMADFAIALAPFGSASAASSADRIARVLGAPRPRLPSAANLAALAAAPPAVAAAQTQGAHAVTGARTAASDGRTPLVAGILVATLAVGAITAVALLRRSPPSPSAAAAAAPLPLSSAPPTATPPPVVSLAAPPAAAAPMASSDVSSEPATLTAAAAHPNEAPGSHTAVPGNSKPHLPANGAAPPARPAPPPPAAPKPPQSKDVFDDRKG